MGKFQQSLRSTNHFHLQQQRMNKIILFLSLVVITIAEFGPQLTDEKETQDLVDSDRVIVDEGKDAFNGMVAAVNSADEKMKAFTGELNKYISQAENAPNQVKY